MYKVYIEDICQIDNIEEFCEYHNYDFTGEDWEFLHTFSTKEEVDTFFNEELTYQCGEDWIAFVVHIENDKVIDINGEPIDIEKKAPITLYIESDNQGYTEVTLPITNTNFKNITNNLDNWHIEYISSIYPGIESHLICESNLTAINVLAYKLSTMTQAQIKNYLSKLKQLSGNIDESSEMAELVLNGDTFPDYLTIKEDK